MIKKVIDSMSYAKLVRNLEVASCLHVSFLASTLRLLALSWEVLKKSQCERLFPSFILLCYLSFLSLEEVGKDHIKLKIK